MPTIITTAVQMAVAFILDAEDPRRSGVVTTDAGGVTRYGIASRYHPGVDVANLTLEQAVQIYADEYIATVLGVVDLGAMKRCADCLVNPGPGDGARVVQMAASLFTPVAVDGVIGTATIEAINRADPDKFIAELRYQRIAWYLRDTVANPAKRPYLNGWLRRACR